MIEKEIINFEKTVIVGIITQNQDAEKLNEYLDKNIPEFPKQVKLELPKLKKIELPKLKKIEA